MVKRIRESKGASELPRAKREGSTFEKKAMMSQKKLNVQNYVRNNLDLNGIIVESSWADLARMITLLTDTRLHGSL